MQTAAPRKALGKDMTEMNGDGPPVHRVMVATNRSETADRAVRWAAHLATSYQAELLIVQVLATASPDTAAPSDRHPEPTDGARTSLHTYATEIAGPRGRALIVVNDDPAQAILDAVEDERVDVLVLGNVGMSGRKEFLLGNIPNRISHRAACTVVIVNTATPDGAGRVIHRPRDEEDAEVEGQLLRRAWKIGRILAGVGLRGMMSRSRVPDEDTTRATARRFRDALDQLGPTFAKLGQILSTRPDLLPPAFIKELATLQERVTPLTEAEVVAAMEQELGVPWEDVFASIDPQPLAAGTIAQVHRATLESGARVVVKVQRPTAEQDIMQDLGLMEMLAARAGERPAFRRVFDIPAMIEHLSTSLRRELDFRQEAANIKRMHDVLAPFPRLDVPAIYEQYSTARLLVMQEIEGVSVFAAPPGPARTEAARQFLEAYYHQVMMEGFFHADPHPGNMKWWNDTIYFLDLGMVGEVDAAMRELILLLLLAFAQRDAGFLTEVVLTLAGSRSGDATDVAAFQADLNDLMARYRDRSLREIQLGPLLQEVTAIAVRHEVRVPAALMLMGKAFAQMQLVAAELDPMLDPFAVAESFILRRTLRQFADRLNPQTLFYETQKAKVRVTKIIESLEGAIGAREGNPFQVRFRGTERLEASVTRASQRLSLSLGLSSIAVVTALAANAPRVPRWVPAMLGGIGATLAARLISDEARRK